MTTLNKKANQLLDELGVRGESEKKYRPMIFDCATKDFKKIGKHTSWMTLAIRGEGLKGDIPAYNLQELITILPQIGEKLGWRARCGNGVHLKRRCVDCIAHKITDIFIKDGMEGVSEYIISLLNKK